jgi:hypothetical protein
MSATGAPPLLHELTAGDLLCSRVTHDLLHLRRLTELRYGSSAAAGGCRRDYAGPW